MGQEESHDVEMDLAEVQEMCIIFMKECPSGVLHLHEFKRIFGVLSSSEEESMYFETIFHSFNTNQDNALDLMEYAEALHLVLRGNLEDRLKWSFKIYDKDRNGKLDRHKVEQIIRIIYSIKLQREEIKMTPNEVCDRIFELVDLNHNESKDDEEVTLQDIQALYRKFTFECPSGNLHLHEFKRIFGVNCNSTEEEASYMENVFQSFDTNQDNKIDFMEFVAAIHLLLRGKLEDKLKWSFKVYDSDGNGSLDRREVKHVIKIIYMLKKHNNPAPQAKVEDICDRIFELIDVNKDGRISLEEFIEGSQKDPWVTDQLKLDITPCGWFLNSKTKP